MAEGVNALNANDKEDLIGFGVLLFLLLILAAVVPLAVMAYWHYVIWVWSWWR